MTLLGKDQILSADDLGTDDIEVPEWGGTVRVRGMTAAERDQFEMRFALAKKNGQTDIEFRAPYAGRCIIDESGKRVFSNADLPALAGKSGAALDRLFDAVRELSGMTDEKLRAAAENFGTAPNGVSPSA